MNIRDSGFGPCWCCDAEWQTSGCVRGYACRCPQFAKSMCFRCGLCEHHCGCHVVPAAPEVVTSGYVGAQPGLRNPHRRASAAVIDAARGVLDAAAPQPDGWFKVPEFAMQALWGAWLEKERLSDIAEATPDASAPDDRPPPGGER